jgi:hypothetical protein
MATLAPVCCGDSPLTVAASVIGILTFVGGVVGSATVYTNMVNTSMRESRRNIADMAFWAEKKKIDGHHTMEDIQRRLDGNDQRRWKADPRDRSRRASLDQDHWVWTKAKRTGQQFMEELEEYITNVEKRHLFDRRYSRFWTVYRGAQYMVYKEELEKMQARVDKLFLELKECVTDIEVA